MIDTANALPGNGAEKAKDFSEQAKDLVHDVKVEAGKFVGEAAQIGKDQSAKLGETAKELAAGAASKLQDTVRQQRAAGAEYIDSVATATERAAGEFERAVPQAAHYIRQASEHIHGVADAVRERDLRDLVGEVETFARRQPTLFFGGAMILGFAALRFLKSSPPAARRDSVDRHPVS